MWQNNNIGLRWRPNNAVTRRSLKLRHVDLRLVLGWVIMGKKIFVADKADHFDSDSWHIFLCVCLIVCLYVCVRFVFDYFRCGANPQTDWIQDSNHSPLTHSFTNSLTLSLSLSLFLILNPHVEQRAVSRVSGESWIPRPPCSLFRHQK